MKLIEYTFYLGPVPIRIQISRSWLFLKLELVLNAIPGSDWSVFKVFYGLSYLFWPIIWLLRVQVYFRRKFPIFGSIAIFILLLIGFPHYLVYRIIELVLYYIYKTIYGAFLLLGG